MNIEIFPKNLSQAFVPISEFNKGGANKIFENVNDVGMKFVFKNNQPIGVILSIEQFEEMREIIENQALLIEAERRIQNSKGKKTITHEEMLLELGISKADLEDMDDVEIEE
ncbi:hypothetical protein [Methanolapillus ohkumae]|uniref:Type II toxin-antitoxin system Phd/YefM family antitoxin n=1 Tax=Methanolapillus ohkumae TaxID=3028298 RepID=A0AA96ZWY9_9EURY|nr:hypothetical protein MsAm2_02290 [Methanosarcinaceae archaeon Am2]